MDNENYSVLAPQPGKQTMFMQTESDICLYGKPKLPY